MTPGPSAAASRTRQPKHRQPPAAANLVTPRLPKRAPPLLSLGGGFRCFSRRRSLTRLWDALQPAHLISTAQGLVRENAGAVNVAQVGPDLLGEFLDGLLDGHRRRVQSNLLGDHGVFELLIEPVDGELNVFLVEHTVSWGCCFIRADMTSGDVLTKTSTVSGA